jgi:hypothetical protein
VATFIGAFSPEFRTAILVRPWYFRHKSSIVSADGDDDAKWRAWVMVPRGRRYAIDVPVVINVHRALL